MNPQNTPMVRLLAVKNAVMTRIVSAKNAAMKHPATRILAAVLLFLLASACASLIGEIVQDLWAMTNLNR